MDANTIALVLGLTGVSVMGILALALGLFSLARNGHSKE